MQESTIIALQRLGEYINSNKPELQEALIRAREKNSWFEEVQTQHALSYWGSTLQLENLRTWLAPYPSQAPKSVKKVGLILAGNIPMVGFHDIITVLLSGHEAHIKYSSSDDVLIPHLLEVLQQIEPKLRSQIIVVDRLNNVEAVIATGSNNSARYFEYYFSKIPLLIRKNRTSIAVLHGTESPEQMAGLGEDIFRYYGQGCRNVSKIFVPEDYPIKHFYEGIAEFKNIFDHHKYRNNYDYYKSIYLVNGEEHFDNGFLILKPSTSLHAPLSVLYMERFSDIESLRANIESMRDELQCILSENPIEGIHRTALGKSQQPALSDYADGVDTMQFLQNL